jgi:hypothetical protein
MALNRASKPAAGEAYDRLRGFIFLFASTCGYCRMIFSYLVLSNPTLKSVQLAPVIILK